MLYKDSELISDAQIQYYKINGLPLDGGASDKWARYKIGPFVMIGFPNFRHRMEAIYRHDLHHIVNNFDTSSLGEGLIAAWELGSGCGRYWISWLMEPQALWWGILYAPKRTFQTFVRGRHSLNFFTENLLAGVKSKTVGEVRKQLLPLAHIELLATLGDYILFLGYSILGLVMIVLFIPVLIFFTFYGLITRQK